MDGGDFSEKSLFCTGIFDVGGMGGWVCLRLKEPENGPRGDIAVEFIWFWLHIL